MANIPAPSGVRKRPCNPDLWKQKAAKKARNSGQEYRSPHNGRIVAARGVGEPCTCSKKCFDAVGIDTIRVINGDYWKLGDHTLQTAFIQRHTTVMPPKRRYTADEASFRSCTRQYHLQAEGGLIPVCKSAFKSALGISLGRIDNALQSQTPTGAVRPDGRGRHQNHSRISPDRLQLVLDHINTFPTVFSHYARYVYLIFSSISFKSYIL